VLVTVSHFHPSLILAGEAGTLTGLTINFNQLEQGKVTDNDKHSSLLQ